MPSFTPDSVKYPLAVTFAYFVLYYIYLSTQSATRYKLKKEIFKARKEKGEKTDGNMNSFAFMRFDSDVTHHPDYVRSERAALNMHEQMVPFILSFWLYCIFVDPLVGSYVGAAYVLGRSMYWAFFHNAKLMILFVTAPNYIEIAYLFGVVLLKGWGWLR